MLNTNQFSVQRLFLLLEQHRFVQLVNLYTHITLSQQHNVTTTVAAILQCSVNSSYNGDISIVTVTASTNWVIA